MHYRFFYVGPRNIILLLQDAYRRAKEAGLTHAKLEVYDIVPGMRDHDRIKASKIANLLRELWKERARAILFYDPGFESDQRKQLLIQLEGSDVTAFPLARPAPTKEGCDRAALMMMSTPLWTQEYLRQTMSADDAYFSEYQRVIAERDELQKKLASLQPIQSAAATSIADVLDGTKKAHHPHTLIVTQVAEKSARTCKFDDPSVVAAGLEAIASYLAIQREKPGSDLQLVDHFRAKGFHFAPTITGKTKKDLGDHYKVEHDGRTYETHMHLKMGEFRLYFDLTNNIAIIGSIGDHLPTAGYED